MGLKGKKTNNIGVFGLITKTLFTYKTTEDDRPYHRGPEAPVLGNLVDQVMGGGGQCSTPTSDPKSPEKGPYEPKI